MKTRLPPILIGILSILFLTSGGLAESEATLGTAFTYQGRMESNGEPYTGSCDFQFRLWDATSGGSAIGSTISLNDLAVTDGLFTASLNFGSSAFNGDARWLEVSVQCPGDASATTFARQELTAAPQALYAPRAAWSGVTGMPTGFADNVDNDTAPGVYHMGTLDSNWISGGYSSVTIGADGLPLISYQYNNMGTIQVAHCRDISCSSADISRLDTPGEVASDMSITTGADGLGLIVYFDQNNIDIKVAHCIDTTCSSADISAVDTDAGPCNDITIGADGLGLISYYDYGELKVAHCNDSSCSSSNKTILDSSLGGYSIPTSITTGSDGLGIISYIGNANKYLKIAHCSNIACTSATITIIDSGLSFGSFSGITVGADGLGLISYVDANSNGFKIAHCNDIFCSSAIYNNIEPGYNLGINNSIATGSDGMGVISYYDDANDDLKVAHCSNVTCSSATTYTLDAGGNVGWFTDITIGVDGLPLISYFDSDNGTLKTVHCSNVFCIPYYRRR
jgi:preprotein translocase subunit Sec61beta